MIERALSALSRFASNATLKISPFESHHGREANTVLRNLTKKPSKQNLNWDRVLKQKSTYLDSNDPRSNKFPPPKATDWEDRSDVDYDVEHINHPKKLAGDHLVSVADRSSEQVAASKNSVGVKMRESEAFMRTELLFQRIKDSNKRNRPLKQKVVSESQLNLTLANGSVLRKIGVAGKAPISAASKFSEKVTPKPPTMVEVKRRADLKRSEEETAAGASARKTIQTGTRAKSQNCDDEDDSEWGSEYEPLQITRYSGLGAMGDELGAGPKYSDKPSTPLARKNTEGEAKTSGGGGAKQSEGKSAKIKRPEEASIEKAENVPNVSGGVETRKISKKKVERKRKQRLVSYSSQESQDSDGAGSRKSSRKRTAATKFGGVMIDSIFKSRKNKGEGERERDTN